MQTLHCQGKNDARGIWGIIIITKIVTKNFEHLYVQEFVVKYLGKKEARGLWGIKHTRKPVDDMVGLAR